MINFSDCMNALNTYGDAEREFGRKVADKNTPITEADREKVRLSKVAFLQLLDKVYKSKNN